MTETAINGDAAATDAARADALPGLVWAFRFHVDGAAEEVDIAHPIELRHDGWLWLHFNLSDRRAGDAVERLLPEQEAALFKSATGRPQLHCSEDGIFGTFVDFERGLDGAP